MASNLYGANELACGLDLEAGFEPGGPPHREGSYVAVVLGVPECDGACRENLERVDPIVGVVTLAYECVAVTGVSR